MKGRHLWYTLHVTNNPSYYGLSLKVVTKAQSKLLTEEGRKSVPLKCLVKLSTDYQLGFARPRYRPAFEPPHGNAGFAS